MRSHPYFDDILKTFYNVNNLKYFWKYKIQTLHLLHHGNMYQPQQIHSNTNIPIKYMEYYIHYVNNKKYNNETTLNDSTSETHRHWIIARLRRFSKFSSAAKIVFPFFFWGTPINRLGTPRESP